MDQLAVTPSPITPLRVASVSSGKTKVGGHHLKQKPPSDHTNLARWVAAPTQHAQRHSPDAALGALGHAEQRWQPDLPHLSLT